MANMLQLILRGVQFFWALLLLALIGNMISLAIGGNPSIVNFDMFVAVFSMLTLFYSIATAVKDGFTLHPMLPLALDVINVFLYFIAGVATAAYLQTGSCNDESYRDNNIVTSGSYNNFQRCREAQAVTVFFWFNFALYVFTTFLSATGGSTSGVSMRGGIRRGPAPTMAQV